MKNLDTTRKCIVNGEVFEKDKLLRFCVTPNNEIIPDFKKKLSGKGVYVFNSKTMLEKAVQDNVFAKVLKKKVKPTTDLVNMVEKILCNNALNTVSLARKAGVLVSGLDKVLEALKNEKIAFVLEAIDAGKDGSQRIRLASKDVEIFHLFNVEEINKALNKENMVYVAFLKSDMANKVNQEFEKLTSFLSK